MTSLDPTDLPPVIHSKPGPKPTGDRPRVGFNTWTAADTKETIQRWTDERRQVDPKWNDGRTLEVMVELSRAPDGGMKKPGRASKPVPGKHSKTTVS